MGAKVMVDGCDVPVPSGTLEVVYEFDEEDGLPEGAQLHFRFTSEGQIVEYVDNERVLDISCGTWSELAYPARDLSRQQGRKGDQ